MTKLRKCNDCQGYSLKDECKCGSTTENAHYKFIKIRDAPKQSDEYWKKRRT
jgi:rRNA maturation protein Nop10